MRKFAAFVFVGLLLAGCAGVGIPNPVTGVDMFRVKTLYAATLEVAVRYRQYCWARPYAVLMADPVARPLCQNRREVVRRIQAGDQRASAAITSADRFVRNNPTLSSASIVSAAWEAVQLFQSSVPAVR